jgi:hypothetical protein
MTMLSKEEIIELILELLKDYVTKEEFKEQLDRIYRQRFQD